MPTSSLQIDNQHVNMMSEGSTTGADSLQTRDDVNYIAIEGVIGAGKTTLARILANRTGGRLVTEEFDLNPFLERFYGDRDRWAFQTQMFFLASRFKQQAALLGSDLFHSVAISDYTFDKDRIFARLNLAGDEMALYDTVFGM